MQEMLRLMLLGFLAGLWLSLEEVQCNDEAEEDLEDHTRSLCCDTEASTIDDDEDCKNLVDGQPLPVCDMSDNRHICKPSGYGIIHVNATASNADGAANKQCTGLCKKQEKNIGKWWCCLCINNHCAVVCRKEEENTGRPTATTKFVAGSTDKTSSATIAGATGEIFSASSIIQHSYASTSSSKSTGQLASYQILLILLALLVVAFIVVAMILIIRKRKFSRRGEVSMTRTNQNEAVSSGYERAVRENHYEPSAEGVPIYTELNLTQEPAPSNSTVYSSVQPTGEAIDMGKRVVYAELDKATVAVSPIYSQPFESEASAINRDYAEPFKPDTTNTATAQVPSQYYNIGAVDQQNDVYSLAKAIPLSDPNVIYSQPNKPTK